MYKIGIGYDIHELVKDRDLIIGGVKLEYGFGLLGHSDADVLIHAIIDAILGALALPDIGTLFPDNDNKYKDIDSKILLKEIIKIIKSKGYKISNIDSNIIAQAPKMMSYIPAMKSVLCPILNLCNDCLSIKAKTKEHMDSVGNNLAIEANAIVLMEKD